MKIKPELLALYGVTDRGNLKNGSLEETVEQVLKGGVTMLQLREKNMPLQEFIREAKAIKKITDFYGVPLIINDRIDVCMECDADGVHIGQSDMQAAQARILLGENKIIGVTAKTPQQALLAQENGADYLGSGAVFGSLTKLDTKKMTLETLDAICESVSIPVAAIGGINASNVMLLKGHKMKGAAVVSALFGAEDPFEAARQLKMIMMEMCGYNH